MMHIELATHDIFLWLFILLFCIYSRQQFHPMKSSTAHNPLFFSPAPAFCSVAPHTSSPDSSEQRQPNSSSHTASHVASATRCVTGSDRGAKYGTISELARNESDGIKAHSRQATHSASRASVRLACAALSLHPSWSITLWSRCEAFFLANTGPGHPRQLVLRHIFSLDPLMSLPAWVSQCK